MQPVLHGSDDEYCIRNVEKMEMSGDRICLGVRSKDMGGLFLAMVESEHKWIIDFVNPQTGVQCVSPCRVDTYS